METLKKSTFFIFVYCLVACGLLFLLAHPFVSIFKAKQDAADLILYFCFGLSTVFFFNGLTFCTNTIFNNLKVAHWATYINLIRATLFTMPFAYFGAKYGGPVGIWVGIYIGSAIVAGIGVALAYYKIRLVAKELEQ
jgi:Na+-driven multidrug efflux pump